MGNSRDVGSLAELTAEPVVADRESSIAEHIRAGMDTRLRALLAHDPGTRLGEDPEELHQMRVSVRRMRAMLKSGRPFLASDWVEPLLDELGSLGRALGPVRDLDVLLGRLREDASDFPEAERSDVARLISGLEAARAEARQEMLSTLDSDRYRELVSTLADVLHHPLPAAPSGLNKRGERGELAGLVDGQFRKLRKAVRRIGTEPEDAQLHALRIRGKRLRYTAELAESTDSGMRKLVRACKRFQDVLGEHQDACVASDRVRGLLADLGDEAHADIGFVAGRLVEREAARRALYRSQWWQCWEELREHAENR